MNSWSPPTGALGDILRDTRDRVRALRTHAAALRERAQRAPGSPPLTRALEVATVAVIAELKRRSPSKGTIRNDLSASHRAAAYAEGGAAAISVLTETISFGGTLDDLVAARATVVLPILRKDFIVDPLQLYESRALGASAVLLIARALPPGSLEDLTREAISIRLEPLIEVRTEPELERAVLAGAKVIGVNNRDLETLEIDPSTVDRILPSIPREIRAVAESGVKTREDVERAAAAGADAVLVGSILSAADDPASAVRELTGVTKRDGRARRG
ncbi:MAG TPA: indole-3-glycerol phosphate synthase TrpC [Gemmatimonadaceae bacterium]|nr:indole-3-glycerol phosphate synthase TrpC [Gemmatimonadaceae bacterium]